MVHESMMYPNSWPMVQVRLLMICKCKILVAAHPLVIPLKVQGVASYFDICVPNIQDYEYDNIPKILLMAQNCLGIQNMKFF